MDRLTYLIKNKRKLLDFINMAVSQDYDCQKCPFCRKDGVLMGCNAGYDYDDIDCQLNYEDVEDFLSEKIPTKKQMDKWKKDWEKEQKNEC